MSQNTTSANSSFLGYVGGESFECLKPLETFTVMINVIAFVINNFHLSIISHLETLRGTKYRCVLINLALADITNTIGMAIFFSCSKFILAGYMRRGTPELILPIYIIMFISNYISFHVFLVASVEKYFVIVWLYIFSLGTIVTVIDVLNLIPGMSNLGLTVFRTAVFAVAPNLVSGTLLIKVYKELKRMRSRSEISAQDSEKTNAAMYLITVFTLEIIVFLLNSISVIFIQSTGNPVLCTIWSGFIKAPYTILNTVIYGWRTQSYRQHVRKLFGCNPHQIGNAEGSPPAAVDVMAP